MIGHIQYVFFLTKNGMVYCNIFVDVGFHFDEIFKARLSFVHPPRKGQQPPNVEVPKDPNS